MAKQELGRVEEVEVRAIWEHEAHDFTPWLAENLDLLGDELGLKLELEGTEVSIGPYALDILAREVDEDVKVAIENQLDEADFGHLGALLAYATGSFARVVVWVAGHFRQEHRAVVDWLNQWTADEIRFFAVEVRAIKIGDSMPAPQLRPVAFPGGWPISKSPVTKALLEERKQYLQFFEPLKSKLIQEGFPEKPVQRFDHTGRHFPSKGVRGVWYGASLEGKNDAWVTLHIEAKDDKERTKQMFDALLADRNDIEGEFDAGKEWHWRRYDRFLFSSISLRRDGSINDSSEDLEDTRTWMATNLREFEEVFGPRLSKILNELADSS